MKKQSLSSSQTIFLSYLKKNLSERLDLVLRVRETVRFVGFRFLFYLTDSDSGVITFFSGDGRPVLFPGGDGSFKHRYRWFFPAPFDLRLCSPLSHCLSFSSSDGYQSCMILGVVGSIVDG